jgi:hypothetical protein
LRNGIFGISLGFALMSYPEAAVVLFLLWLFWEELGSMTIESYEDRQVSKVRKALCDNIFAQVDLRYVHLMIERDRTEREQKAKDLKARERLVSKGQGAVSTIATALRKAQEEVELTRRKATVRMARSVS